MIVRYCIYCGSTDIQDLAENMFKCYECEREFSRKEYEEEMDEIQFRNPYRYGDEEDYVQAFQ